jgi:hypothetical protein
MSPDSTNHKVHIFIYRVPQCMSPRRNWDSPIPFPASECALPPGTKGGGGGPVAGGWGVGKVPIPTTGEKLSTLRTLWYHLMRQTSWLNQLVVTEKEIELRRVGHKVLLEDHPTIKTPNHKCRLYWCLSEFKDWRYSQSCWYFSTGFVNYCPANLLTG